VGVLGAPARQGQRCFLGAPAGAPCAHWRRRCARPGRAAARPRARPGAPASAPPASARAAVAAPVRARGARLGAPGRLQGGGHATVGPQLLSAYPIMGVYFAFACKLTCEAWPRGCHGQAVHPSRGPGKPYNMVSARLCPANQARCLTAEAVSESESEKAPRCTAARPEAVTPCAADRQGDRQVSAPLRAGPRARRPRRRPAARPPGCPPPHCSRRRRAPSTHVYTRQSWYA